MSPVPLLELSGVSRRFPGVSALDQVDFAVSAGEVHALVGEDGAGKSTLVQVLAGVLVPDSGQVRVAGRPVRLTGPVAARRRGIVVVHQEPELFGALSVAENMALAQGLPASPLGGIRRRQLRTAARTALAALGAAIDVRLPAARLNVAQRKMVQLAAALAQRGRIVVLDEPTAGLGALESAWLLDQVVRLRDDGVGLIYVAHTQDDVFRLADRITVLRDGRRIWTGDAHEIDGPGLVRAAIGRNRDGHKDKVKDSDNDNETPPGSRPSPAQGRASRVLRPRSKTARLRVRGLTDARGRFEAVDLDAHAGEILGIYGVRGAGRSAWAETLFGLRRAARGRIEIDGYPHTFSSPRAAVGAGIAYLPEDRRRQALCLGLSVRANMVLNDPALTTLGPLAVAPVESTVTHEQLTALGIPLADIAQPIAALSAASQQKVVLGRWLLTAPKVLILDEPTRGVDTAGRDEIHRLLRLCADRGCALVVISSDCAEVRALSDRVGVFREGRGAAVLDPRDATPEALADMARPHAALGTGKPYPAGPARRRLRGEFRGRAAILAVVLAAFATLLTATTGGRFQSTANLHSLVTSAAPLTILALGAAVVIIAGGIDISIGSLLALSAGVGGLVMTHLATSGQGVPLGILAALAVGAAGGLLNGSLSLAGRIPPIVVTLLTLTLYRGLLLGLAGSRLAGGLPAAFRRLAIGRLRGTHVEGALVLTAATALVLHLLLARSRPGRHLHAFGANPRAARLVGITRGPVWLGAFAAGGLLAALAGLLELAQRGAMPPGPGIAMGMGMDMDTNAALRAIAAAVLGGTALAGGRGGVPGVVLGAWLLAVLENALVLWSVPAHEHDLVFGGILLAAILGDRVLRRPDP